MKKACDHATRIGLLLRHQVHGLTTPIKSVVMRTGSSNWMDNTQKGPSSLLRLLPTKLQPETPRVF